MHIYLNCVYFHFEMCFDFSRSLVLRNDKTLILHIQNMNLSPWYTSLVFGYALLHICTVRYVYWYCIVYTHVPTLLSHIPSIKVNWTAATNMPQHTSIECSKSTASIIRRTPLWRWRIRPQSACVGVEKERFTEKNRGMYAAELLKHRNESFLYTDKIRFPSYIAGKPFSLWRAKAICKSLIATKLPSDEKFKN